MGNTDEQDGNNNWRWISLLIVLLIVIAAGYFNKDVFFNLQTGELRVTSGTTIDTRTVDTKTIFIKQINTRKPDYVVLKNATDQVIDIAGYELLEGVNSYKIGSDSVDTNLSPRENMKIYFVGNASPLLGDTTKLASDSFRIKAGETIELKDPLGNTIDTSKAL